MPAFLTLSVPDCFVNLPILSMVDLAGVLERRLVWPAVGLSLSLSFAWPLSVPDLGTGLVRNGVRGTRESLKRIRQK